jgi:hypothetical protein
VVNRKAAESALSIDDAINDAIIRVERRPLPREEEAVAGPRKVRVFRDPKKSPNWYVEWRDMDGRRHCESCGPHRQDARHRAGQIAEQLRQQRLEAKRLAQRTQQVLADAATTRATESNPGGSALELQGLLRCAQFELPITVLLQVPPVLLTALARAIPEPDQQ